MRISTEIGSAADLVGEEKAVLLTAQAGFQAWDFSMFVWGTAGPGRIRWRDKEMSFPEVLRRARNLRNIGLDNGIVCNQSHAPFPTHLQGVRDMLKLAIECTAEAGGEICVVHPMNDAAPEENAELYTMLLPFAREHGVKLAAENMWNWAPGTSHSCFAACSTSESFLAHLNAVNDPFFVACLDIGHAEMQGSGDGAGNMIRALGPRLQALHLHDNDRIHDSHQIPGSMSIDFGEVVTALRDIGYGGWFTLEADRYLSAFKEDTVLKGLKDMAAAARRLEAGFPQP